MTPLVRGPNDPFCVHKEFDCPWCGHPVILGHDFDTIDLAVLHRDPMCTRFEEVGKMSAVEFLGELQKQFNRKMN